jgi:CBS domain-containing protein
MTTTSGPPPEPRHIAPSCPVRVVDERTSVAEALRVMRVAGVRHLPVVTDGRCVGVLLDRDVVAAAVEGITGPAARWARSPVPTVAPGDPPHVVARAMLAGGLGAALVVDDGVVVGIITATDALAALAEGPVT